MFLCDTYFYCIRILARSSLAHSEKYKHYINQRCHCTNTSSPSKSFIDFSPPPSPGIQPLVISHTIQGSSLLPPGQNQVSIGFLSVKQFFPEILQILKLAPKNQQRFSMFLLGEDARSWIPFSATLPRSFIMSFQNRLAVPHNVPHPDLSTSPNLAGKSQPWLGGLGVRIGGEIQDCSRKVPSTTCQTLH